MLHFLNSSQQFSSIISNIIAYIFFLFKNLSMPTLYKCETFTKFWNGYKIYRWQKKLFLITYTFSLNINRIPIMFILVKKDILRISQHIFRDSILLTWTFKPFWSVCVIEKKNYQPDEERTNRIKMPESPINMTQNDDRKIMTQPESILEQIYAFRLILLKDLVNHNLEYIFILILKVHLSDHNTLFNVYVRVPIKYEKNLNF